MSAVHERVLREQEELTAKLTRLKNFITGYTFKDLGPTDQTLLKEQRRLMTKYDSILRQRIERFIP